MLSIAGALAASDAVRALTGLACVFKWPNDVLLNGRKVCGVLTEVRADTDGDITAVLGVGLNVNLRPTEHAEIAEGAASLASEMGIEFAVADAEQVFLAGLRERYAQCLDAPQTLVGDWSARLATLGKEVTVRRQDGAVHGVAQGVDDVGRLLGAPRVGGRARASGRGDRDVLTRRSNPRACASRAHRNAVIQSPGSRMPGRRVQPRAPMAVRDGHRPHRMAGSDAPCRQAISSSAENAPIRREP